MSKTKRCSCCREAKKVEEFNKNRNMKDGLQSYCRKCQGSNLDSRRRQIQTGIETFSQRKKRLLEQGLKRCSCCKKDKKVVEFGTRKRRGKTNVRCVCKACEKVARTNLIKRRKKESKNRDTRYFEINKKRCTMCEELKKLKFFNKMARSKDGVRTVCKECQGLAYKEYMNDEDVTKKRKAYSKNYLSKPRNKQKRCQYSKTWFSTPKGQDWLREYKKTDHCKKLRKAARARRGKLNCNMGTYMGMSLRGKKNGRHWEDLVDYTLKDLKSHLELLFRRGMNWNNYGGKGKGLSRHWVVDHVIPLKMFNITSYDCDDFARAWSLNNLQPLWAKDNCSKGDKILPPSHPLMPKQAKAA